MSIVKLYQGDCLEVMDKLIADGIKVDAIITDPPYGTTACKWDSVIPFEPMWERLRQLRKDNSAIVLFGSEPFSSALRMSNIKEFKYDWKWIKTRPVGHAQAKNKPLNSYEDIIVFSNGVTVHKTQTKKRMTYNPQGLIKVDRLVSNSESTLKNGSDSGFAKRPSHKKQFIQEFTNYPTNTITFKHERGFHPTQKPVLLLEYLIKTYTNEGDTVLDFTMGSGSTGVACVNTNRNFIGIELDENYFKIAEQRISEAKL
jgi:site-specific DNA-methyltransferase (adenine-specific)